MNLSRKIWRIVTRPWKDDDGKDRVSVELTGPGFYTRVDKGVTERPAVPKPILGPFKISCNGYCIQLISGDDRLVGVFDINSATNPMSHRTDIIEHEEALWISQEVVNHLNSLENKGGI